jgi:phospholipase A1/A2
MGRCRAAICLLLGLVLFGAGALSAADAPREPFPFSLIDTGRGLTLHKELYLLPFTYSNLHHGPETEVVFQLSAKHDLFKTSVYVAYTQISYWQAYNADASSPFRDTNFNPEIFYRHRETRVGPGLLGADVGAEHESNGQRLPLSRSWNLLYVAPWYRGDQWLASVKLRYRLPEDAKTSPEDPLGDDNPEITDYLGHSDIHLYYAFSGGHLLHVLMRGYLGTHRGNVNLNYSFPLSAETDTYVVVRLFSGYGASLMDYNKSANLLGVGIMFNR